MFFSALKQQIRCSDCITALSGRAFLLRAWWNVVRDWSASPTCEWISGEDEKGGVGVGGQR